MNETLIDTGRTSFGDIQMSDGETESETIDDFSQLSERMNVKIELTASLDSRSETPVAKHTIIKVNDTNNHFRTKLSDSQSVNEDKDNSDDMMVEISKKTTIKKIISRTTSVNGVLQTSEFEEFIIKDSHVNENGQEICSKLSKSPKSTMRSNVKESLDDSMDSQIFKVHFGSKNDCRTQANEDIAITSENGSKQSKEDEDNEDKEASSYKTEEIIMSKAQKNHQGNKQNDWSDRRMSEEIINQSKNSLQSSMNKSHSNDANENEENIKCKNSLQNESHEKKHIKDLSKEHLQLKTKNNQNNDCEDFSDDIIPEVIVMTKAPKSYQPFNDYYHEPEDNNQIETNSNNIIEFPDIDGKLFNNNTNTNNDKSNDKNKEKNKDKKTYKDPIKDEEGMIQKIKSLQNGNEVPPYNDSNNFTRNPKRHLSPDKYQTGKYKPIFIDKNVDRKLKSEYEYSYNDRNKSKNSENNNKKSNHNSIIINKKKNDGYHESNNNTTAITTTNNNINNINNNNNNQTVKWVDPMKSHHLKYDLNDNGKSLQRWINQKRISLIKSDPNKRMKDSTNNRFSASKSTTNPPKVRNQTHNEIKEFIIRGNIKENLFQSRHLPPSEIISDKYNYYQVKPKTKDSYNTQEKVKHNLQNSLRNRLPLNLLTESLPESRGIQDLSLQVSKILNKFDLIEKEIELNSSRISPNSRDTPNWCCGNRHLCICEDHPHMSDCGCCFSLSHRSMCHPSQFENRNYYSYKSESYVLPNSRLDRSNKSMDRENNNSYNYEPMRNDKMSHEQHINYLENKLFSMENKLIEMKLNGQKSINESKFILECQCDDIERELKLLYKTIPNFKEKD